MTSCNVDHSDYRNNGLITKIWGEPGWEFNHAVTFGYPFDPTEEQKKAYKQYFISLGNVLPCRYCRESYQKFITTGNTALTDDVLENRDTLTTWFYNIHEAVNQKLGVDYGVTKEDMVARYESFRARCNMSDPAIRGCVTPLDYKAFSYRKLNEKDCPIVYLELCRPFIRLAKIRGVDDKYFIYLKLAYEKDGNFTELKKDKTWSERNIFCQKQIKYMRESAISSIEQDGEWAGTPTVEELKLFLFLCSNLNKTEIKDCIVNLATNPTYFDLLNKPLMQENKN